jgi:hypothetical protein
MIQVRSVFQAKANKGPDLVALLKESSKLFTTQHEAHILTDTNGPIFTVVTEVTFDSIAAWEQEILQAVAKPEFGALLTRIIPLIHSGSREVYSIEV